MSLPVRGAWIEILQGKTQLQVAEAMSLPVRGAWIEIADTAEKCIEVKVAPRAGSVD